MSLCLREAGPLRVPSDGGPLDVLDVDADSDTRTRYGHKIPVLLFAGELVCHGRLDTEEVLKALAYHR